MKKLTFILCALVLASCAPENKISCPPAPQETDTDISIIQSAEQENKNVFYLEGDFPDIGGFSNNKERFYHGYTPDFIPSSEYGTIIPYIGGYKNYSTQYDPQGQYGYASYGFCTPEGKIVMDASDKIEYVGLTATDDFEYYHVTYRQDENDPGFMVVPSKTLIIPKSGEWCIDVKSGYVSSVGDGAICITYPKIENDDVPYTEIYDYNGEKISTITGYDSIGCYSHGLMTAASWGNGNPDDHALYYVDINGNKVLGPYKSGSDFEKNGLASVSDESGDSYLIDTKGNRITYGNYKFIHAMSHYDGKNPDGRILYSAEVKEKYATRDILNEKGEVMGTAKGGSYVSFCFPKNGEILYYYRNNDDTFTWKRLSDGSEFASSEYGVSPNQYHSSDNIFVYCDEDKKTGLLMDGDGNTVAVLEKFDRFSGATEDGRYIYYVSLDDEIQTPGVMNIYDTLEKRLLYSTTGSGYISFSGNRYALISLFHYNGGLSGASSHSLYDLKNQKLVIDGARSISVHSADGKTYYNIVTRNACTLYDGEMNVIMKTYFE